jgi:hypothetical protein
MVGSLMVVFAVLAADTGVFVAAGIGAQYDNTWAVATMEAVAQAKPSAPTADDEAKDLSDFLSALLAFGGGLGVNGEAPRRQSVSAATKVGIPVAVKGDQPHETLRTLTVDLGYDRIRSRNGFSTELSLMLPLLRFPTPHSERANYLRIYAEPGAGYRFGRGGFGPYASAKLMIALFSNYRLTALSGPASPFVEIQRRSPFSSLQQGDTRIVIGIIGALCNHCGE